LVFLSILLGVRAEDDAADDTEAKDEDYIAVLTKDNFEKMLEKNERVLVHFHPTTGCVKCDDLTKEYAKASKLLKAEQLESLVAKLDATANAELAAKFEVTKFPSIKYFVKGKFEKDYDGKRDSDGTVLWLKNKEDPPVEIKKEEELQAWLDDIEEDNFALVVHVKKKSVRYNTFVKVAEDTLREWDIAKIKFAAVYLPKTADAKKDAVLTMHRPGIKAPDEAKITYTGNWAIEKIARWAQEGCYPTLSKKFNRNQYAPQSLEAFGWSATVVGVVDDNTEIEGQEDKKKDPDDLLLPKVEQVLTPLADENPKWKFAIAEIEKLEDHELELLGVAYGTEPRIVVLVGDELAKKTRKYHLVGEDKITDTEEVKKFFEDVKAKKATQHFRSEPTPENELDDDGVLILTGNTFEEKVMDENKDVFVEFYAPWCKQCEALKPEWASMMRQGAKAGWSGRDVVIAKMDASANECEEEVPSFPRMVLYPAVKASQKMKKRQVYAGGRKATALYDFVTESAVNLQEGEDDEDDEEEEEKPKKKAKKADKKEL